jgi:4'-phosphopantetheinyl transferase
VVRRGVLRLVLGWYLGSKPERLLFEYNGFGKPTISGQSSQRSIQFNLTHSGGLALIAITRSRAVGVDIERLDPSVNALEIGERFFSRCEVTTLRGLYGSARTEAFFRCWTKKEAYLKARGMGLTVPLDRLRDDVAHGHAAPLSVWDERAKRSRWSIQHLSPTPCHVATLVVEN